MKGDRKRMKSQFQKGHRYIGAKISRSSSHDDSALKESDGHAKDGAHDPVTGKRIRSSSLTDKLEACGDVDGNQMSVEKELKMLSFKNPGKFMEDFDPERSSREMRKMNRRIYKESIRKNQLYDESGLLLENSQDLCDCLDLDCPGCHFPCPKCGSEKCGTECRCNRRWVYDYVHVEGTDVVMKWPSYDQL